MIQQQFKEGAIIRLNAIKKDIVCTTKADFNFKLNFLVLFVNTFCESTSMGRCNLFPLSYISRKTDINTIDWINYVLDCVVRRKNSYIPYSDNSYFFFYADNIHTEALTVTRKRPTICYWSSKKIRYRETFEQEKSRFGLAELNEIFFNEQDKGDTYLEDNDSDRDEDHSVEEYESKLSKMLNSFERMKEKLNSKLNNAITKFPAKESCRIFKEKMKNIIVEEKTESTNIFEFPSNETGVEGINLTPLMAQKTNDQQENEDKEGNGEEDNDNDESQPENEGINNDGEKNKKEGETEVKEKDGQKNENDNDEEKKDDDVEETNNHEETIQQTENENMLDKVVDNNVDNVLEIGFSSLNRQEDEIWNNPEMKSILDNIDIGSPMTGSKTNTVISQVIQEKGKSEVVHKQGKEVEKTKGDDTGKENFEHGNKGAEAKNTKDGGADKQTKIEKGNAEDRERIV
uniref:Uncharacterized protein n=1 Tax=Lactuca sativa TaxID=4236 RepID=A0A9R1XX49_LACSA|nr:hypothetical protein LSAT_V11C100033850 [Lactuca sativa]